MDGSTYSAQQPSIGSRITDHRSPITDHGTPGRSCPPHYGYSPRVFARPAEVAADTVYVIGGLYGNLPALDEIERMAALEPTEPRLIFNGDFHWFDVAPDLFAQVQARVLEARHPVLRGNVETEIASDSDAAGCGCAYPESVPDDDVARSNAILQRLRGAANHGQRGALAALPMHAVAQIGDSRIGVVHGDAWSLAGWRFAQDALFDDAQSAQLEHAFALAAVDGFASSHTCLPALKLAQHDARERFVINNGAAGMPNFAGARGGLISRISLLPVPAALADARAYGADVAGVYVDALAVNFDFETWRRMFLDQWPAGSDAHVSYFGRIVSGPAFAVDDALGRGGARSCALSA
jgi:hypothetical protein